MVDSLDGLEEQIEPRAKVIWVERSPSMKRARDSEVCRIGRHVEVANDVLEAAAANHLSWAAIDLLTIAAAVAFADRSLTRHRSASWGRQFNLHLPVYDLPVWTKPQVATSLADTLRYLTGDSWHFSFRRETQPFKARQRSLPFSSYDDFEKVVVPFSDGLDSYAQWQLLTEGNPNLFPIRITTKTGSIPMGRLWRESQEGGKKHLRVGVMLKLRGKLREPTYRTRGFLFLSIAAVAAQLFGAYRIVVPENGQGAIGPSLLASAGEWPLRGTYPAFTSRLASFLTRALNHQIRFEHPGLWMTKGEVLLALAKTDKSTEWQKTRSCSRSVRNLRGKTQCGICGGCLLRRMSLHAASLVEDRAKYAWWNLDSDQLKSPRNFRAPTKNEIHIAYHNALQLQWFGGEGLCAPSQSEIEAAVVELSSALASSRGVIRSQLSRLMSRHEKEWNSFAGTFSSDAWINNLIISA